MKNKNWKLKKGDSENWETHTSVFQAEIASSDEEELW
jgi:hypothetical protein